ncbi:MAG TPA: hypothetical protein VD694_07880 [Nitrososphaeraceae archaeon]|nr:hypothetical protein [Nitrososphaeraceae archaeon]
MTDLVLRIAVHCNVNGVPRFQDQHVMGTKERKVLNRELSVILRMDWSIKFVGMVDRNGKLLVGEAKIFH